MLFRKIPSIAITTLIITACGGGSSSNNPGATPESGSGGGTSGFVYQVPSDLNDGWTLHQPNLTKFDTNHLVSLMNSIQAGSFAVVDSIAIAYKGELVFDQTMRTRLDRFDDESGNTELSIHSQFSVSKSIAAILTGIAIDNQDIAGIEASYLGLFPYSGYANESDTKSRITLADVLKMRAGFNWDEWNPGYFHPDNQLFTFHADHFDWTKGLLDLAMKYEPGEVFSYNTVSSTTLGQAIESSQPLMLIDYLQTYLFLPLNIINFNVFETPTNLPDMGRGLFLSSRDLLKFGQLVLAKGSWNGQQLISESWLFDMLEPHTELGWIEPEKFDWKISGYGYQWWIGTFTYENRELTTYAARGFGNQTLMIIPDLDLTIAINAHGYSENEDEQEIFRLILQFVIPAVI